MADLSTSNAHCGSLLGSLTDSGPTFDDLHTSQSGESVERMVETITVSIYYSCYQLMTALTYLIDDVKSFTHDTSA